MATVKLRTPVCASGDGGFEMAQQFWPAFETVTGGFSPCTIPMRSQSAIVGGMHSFAARQPESHH